ncbi:hypothetical protein [uncultured Roseobacter sp.]|uniref:hypothetical protein n=1 Tax=uncultured Roseobacter sp. TaxID=114847 RepID=UPI00261EA80B|nr:hypothetical protein [uncultured Roseobacter sp.]
MLKYLASVFFPFFLVVPMAFAQGQISTGDCSPNILNSSGSVTITCFNGEQKRPLKSEITYEIQSIGGYESQVIATVDGIPYVALKPDAGLTFEIATGDFDNNGHTDLLYSWSSGGNCCPPSFGVLSYFGNGVFKDLTHDDFWSWNDPELTTRGTKTRFRVDSVVSGMGGTETSSTMNVFEIADGELVQIENGVATAYVPSLVELFATDFEKYAISKSQTISVGIDVDLDNEQDTMVCSWWERWGLIVCEIHASAKGMIETSTGCTRVGVLETSSDGVRDLVCNRDTIMRYSAASNRYSY